MNSSAEQQLSPRTQAALQYLRRTNQGYAIERYLAATGKFQVRLKRRNVPVSDEDFEEIVVDRSAGHVVGIRERTPREGRGRVLVDKSGKPVANGALVTVWLANAATTGGAARGSTGTTRRKHGGAASAALSDEENKRLLMYAGMALGALMALKIVVAVVTPSGVLLLPLLYFYLLSTCPSNASFDTKKEIKRVMRGAHLPEEQQPRGLFEQGLNRLAASVTTELATSLGYDTETMECGGAATLMTVRVPVAGAEYYWLGIVGKWRYVGQREIGNQND